MGRAQEEADHRPAIGALEEAGHESAVRAREEAGPASDEVLLARYRAGDRQVADQLLDRYKNLVRKKANTLFLFGGETDDLIQEGMIGLFKAMEGYDETKGSFFQYAQTCMNHQMYHAIEAAGRKKHAPLNSYISFSAGETDDAWTGAGAADPEQILIDRESVELTLQAIASSLSQLELAVLNRYMDGKNYRQIAAELDKSPKVIDNALQRIRQKVQKITNQ